MTKETVKQCKILKASRMNHIECECGYLGESHTGECPRCGATEIMPEEHLQMLAEHQENVRANKNVAKSLQNFETATGRGE